MICFGGAAIFGGCIILRKYFVHVAEDKDTREQAAVSTVDSLYKLC